MPPAVLLLLALVLSGCVADDPPAPVAEPGDDPHARLKVVDIQDEQETFCGPPSTPDDQGCLRSTLRLFDLACTPPQTELQEDRHAPAADLTEDAPEAAWLRCEYRFEKEAAGSGVGVGLTIRFLFDGGVEGGCAAQIGMGGQCTAGGGQGSANVTFTGPGQAAVIRFAAAGHIYQGGQDTIATSWHTHTHTVTIRT